MKYACFASLDDLELMSEIGFDGVELNLNEVRALTVPELKDLKVRLEKNKLQVCSCSWILPNDVHICDDAFDKKYWLSQFESDADRLAFLGCRTMVFAAGPIRRVGKDEDTSRKKAIINDFIIQTARVFRRSNVRLALETVCFDYTDYLTYIPESNDFITKSGEENLYLICDIRHIVRAGDDPDNLVTYGDRIIHLHIDNPIRVTRELPLPGDGYSYHFYLSRGVKTKSEWLSFECSDEKDYPYNGKTALNYVKNIVNQYLSGGNL